MFNNDNIGRMVAELPKAGFADPGSLTTCDSLRRNLRLFKLLPLCILSIEINTHKWFSDIFVILFHRAIQFSRKPVDS